MRKREEKRRFKKEKKETKVMNDEVI